MAGGALTSLASCSNFLSSPILGWPVLAVPVRPSARTPILPPHSVIRLIESDVRRNPQLLAKSPYVITLYQKGSRTLSHFVSYSLGPKLWSISYL